MGLFADIFIFPQVADHHGIFPDGDLAIVYVAGFPQGLEVLSVKRVEDDAQPGLARAQPVTIDEEPQSITFRLLRTA